MRSSFERKLGVATWDNTHTIVRRVRDQFGGRIARPALDIIDVAFETDH